MAKKKLQRERERNRERGRDNNKNESASCCRECATNDNAYDENEWRTK